MKIMKTGMVLLDSSNSNGLILFLSMGIAALLGSSFYAWMLWSRRKQKKSLESEWHDFTAALEANDIEKINTFGNIVIWNWYLAPPERRFMLAELTKRIKAHPELESLWREVHNRTLGHYPPDPMAHQDDLL